MPQKWAKGQPNGRNVEKCIVAGMQNNRKIPKGFDSIFLPDFEKIILRGIANSKIIKGQGRWVMTSEKNGNLTVTNSEFFPLGLKIWQDSSGNDHLLKLTQCNRSSFTSRKLP